jgi:hypothetical protein
MDLSAKSCPECGSDLTPAEPRSKKGLAGPYRVAWEHFPALACPRGCAAGSSDGAPSLTDILALAKELTQTVAKTRGVLAHQPVCRTCEGLLAESGEGRWTIQVEGLDLCLTIEGPGLTCERCGARYLPADGRARDLQRALTEGLA